MPRSRPDAIAALVGAAVFAVAAATTIGAPSATNLIVTIDSPGANRVVVPVVDWAAVALAAAVVARARRSTYPAALAQTAVVAFWTHVLLLLAASAGWMMARPTYSTGIYWMYARCFYAVAAAAAVAWSVRQFRSPDAERMWLGLVPIALAAATLSAIVARYDLPTALGGVSAGLAAGATVATRRISPSLSLAGVRRIARNERLVLGAAVLLALAVRLMYTARVMSDPNYIETGGDARFYDRLAVGLVDGQSVASSGYPLLILGYVRLLAVIYRLFGHSYLAVCLIQSLIGAAAVIGIWSIGKPVFGAAASLITAVFTAVSFQLAFSAVAIGHQALDIGVTVLVVWLLIAADRMRPRLWPWLLAGVALGCAIAVRETSAFFLGFVFAWLAWTTRPRGEWPAFGRAAVALTAGAAAILAPLLVPMVATADRRLQLRRHFDRLATSHETKGREGLAGPLSHPDQALAQLREQPGFVLRAEARTVGTNFAVQFFTQPYGEFDLVSLRKESDYYYGVWCYAYLLTVVGMAAAARRIRAGDRQSAALALMLGLVVSRTIPHLFLESAYRHRAPLEPFLILFCAAGVVTVIGTAWPALAGERAALRAAS